MKKNLVAATLAVAVLAPVPIASAAVPATPTVAAGYYDQQEIKRTFVRVFYNESRSTQRDVCNAWDYNYKRTVMKYVRISVRNGYSYNDAVKGLVRGFLAVCGSPDSYSG